MADERDFELLDDYLTNRMREQERSAFEQKLKADPDLQQEYALQKHLIRGIKQTRVMELKSMLNNVPVPAGNPGSTLATKIIVGTAVSLMIVAAAFWYFKDDAMRTPDLNSKSEKQVPLQAPVTPQVEPETTPELPESVTTEQSSETDKNQTSAGTEHSKPSLAKKPAPLAAPGEKKTDGPTPNEEKGPAMTPATSSVMVETERNNGRYTFHYQFREGKLILYGPFEKDLYEIMEFLSDEKRQIFLRYKEQYYLLPQVNDQITPLTPVSDPALIQKLKEHRDSK